MTVSSPGRWYSVDPSASANSQSRGATLHLSQPQKIGDRGATDDLVRRDVRIVTGFRQDNQADEGGGIPVLQFFQFFVASKRTGAQAKDLVHLQKEFFTGH